MPSSDKRSWSRCPGPSCCAGTPENGSGPPPPVREDPLWELVGVDHADNDPGGRVDIDEVVCGGNR